MATTEKTAKRQWFREIEIHASHYEDGRRWCDFCSAEVFPKQKQHEDPCPIREMLTAAIARATH